MVNENHTNDVFIKYPNKPYVDLKYPIDFGLFLMEKISFK